MAVKADAIRVGERVGLAYVVQQHSPRQRERRLSHPLQHEHRMGPHVALGMILRRLLHAPEGTDFGQQLLQ